MKWRLKTYASRHSLGQPAYCVLLKGSCFLRIHRTLMVFMFSLVFLMLKMYQIKEATGMTSVSDIVNNFLQAEEKNFSLFNFVNDLNR